MNYIIIGRERLERHPTKNANFDIFSLADQLYQSRSIFPESLKPKKIYFLENTGSNLLQDGIKTLSI